MLACGIGCRRGTSAEEIQVAIEAARVNAGFVGHIAVLVTETTKVEEPGLQEVARRLGVALVSFSAEELRGVAGSVPTFSETALQHKGTPSVAEAAAVLAAGKNARLLGPRWASATTTCAFAVGDGREP